MNLLGLLPLRAPAPPRVELCALVRKNLDVAAHSAATSPLNLRPQPTEGQRSAGNYKKGHVRFAGLDITIENPAGSYRRPEWPVMQAHYGYVKGTEGKDGDHVDCFLRPATPLDWRGNAYVINQLDASGVFDEHKVMLGYDDQRSAERAYLAHYPRDWRLGPVAEMSLARLREWLNGDTLEPVMKGEGPGHPFRGNQHVSVSTTPASRDELDYNLSNLRESGWEGTGVVVHKDGKLSGPPAVMRELADMLHSSYDKNFGIDVPASRATAMRALADRIKTQLAVKKVSLVSLAKREWREEDHPRDDRGRFGEGTGGFSNKDGVWYQNGKPASPEIQARMKELAVPPGWRQVELNPDPDAALLVVGRDSKDRQVYIRSAEKDKESAAEKFARLQEFNKVQGAIRDKAIKDMQDTSLSQPERDTAAALALISVTGFRPGSDKDTGADKQAHGATTLKGDHVTVEGSKLRFDFVGKKGVDISHETEHPELARYIASRKAENGDGRLFQTSDRALRDYFKASGGNGFKVKDFRTWNGTMAALKAIDSMKTPSTLKEFKAARAAVGDAASAFLGNTRAVALSSYIHPAVFSKWEAALQ